MDYYYNQINSNMDIQNRDIFFTNISREKLSKKKSFSKENIMLKKSNSVLLETDLSIEMKKPSLNLSTFSSAKKSSFEEEKNCSISNDNFPSLSNTLTSTIESEKKTNTNKNNKDISMDMKKRDYQKIISKNISNISNEKIKNNAIFIFDWDDTLFFTSHLKPTNNIRFFYQNDYEKKLMSRIEYYIIEILNIALDKGTVLIITNSGEGWVEASAKYYYPNLIPLLKDIYIISSRELYQKEYPGKPLTWKINTFYDLKEKLNFKKDILINIICIGDDNSEIIAAKKLGENFDKCLVKTIKFRESPDLKELIKQLILINEQIIRVYNYPKSLTIQVEKKKNTKIN